LTDDDRRMRVLFEILDKIGSRKDDKGVVRDFTLENALQLKCNVLRKRGLLPELKTLINHYIHLPAIREIAIQDAIDGSRFEEAQKLSFQGIELAEQKEQPGLKDNWIKFLLEIAKKESNTEDIQKYNRVLFLNTGNMEYYEELRRQCPVSEWSDYLQKIFDDIPKDVHYYDVISKILIREENWKELLSYVKENSECIYFVAHYHDYLIKHYPKELSEMYGQALRKAIANAHSRDAYRRVCPIIKKMEQCGFTENVRDLVEWIRKTYSFRSALLDELSKVVRKRY